MLPTSKTKADSGGGELKRRRGRRGRRVGGTGTWLMAAVTVEG